MRVILRPRLCLYGILLPATIFGAALFSALVLPATGATFMNFETAPVHPIALSPDALILAVCNLPDARVELFDVSSGVPLPLGDARVGLDPVSLRFRTTNELWVVNHISRTISIVDVARHHVMDTITTLYGPADIAFAGSRLRAFVSCAKENTVQVFDALTRQLVANVVINGERPKAMTVSPDGSKVYVAIFESGNASTLVTSNVLRHPAGPYGGQVPVPNDGVHLRPPLYLNPALPSELYTDLQPDSLIVKKNAAGRWMDDNNGDWTEFISGTNSAVSGRPPGWDMPDRDVAIIDAGTLQITYATGLMNICMDVAVNPASGKITVVGTDGANERRFEPNLRGTFIHVNLALVDSLTLAKAIVDLNPHLDYSTSSVASAVRDLSIGDPRGIVWNSAGTHGYVTGMGSRNLVVIDANGNRVNVQPVQLAEGPSGLALDEARQRLYVLNRFSATISVLDTTTLSVVANVAFFDPTPAAIKRGRKHLYDTRRNSGLGQLACASCHVDARFDRLAWDLGNPSADMGFLDPGGAGFMFHPMKGPLVTQTLQDIIGSEPLHWRGDRPNIESFNVTFTDLQARDAPLTTNEMQEFKDFLAMIFFPPNRFRNLDNSLSTNLPLLGFYGVDAANRPDRTPLPNGNAQAGVERFTVGFIPNGDCIRCHKHVSGRGDGGEDDFLIRRAGPRPFKVAQLRSVPDKLGMDLLGTESRAGFGLRFDGRADSLTRFLVDVLGATNNQEIANLTAFVLSFPGDPDFFTGLGPPSKHARAAVGWQITLRTPGGDPLVTAMMKQVHDEGPFDFVATGIQNGVRRSWVSRDNDLFQSDLNTEALTLDELLALAGPGTELTFTIVPRGTGWRIGIDRDEDGVYDRSEIEAGLDPTDPLSRGSNAPPQIDSLGPYFVVHPGMTISASFHATDPDLPGQKLIYRFIPATPPGASLNPTNGLFTWTVPTSYEGFDAPLWVQVTDDGNPPLSDVQGLPGRVRPFRVLRLEKDPLTGGNLIVCTVICGARYRLQFKDRIEASVWTDAADTVTGNCVEIRFLDVTATEAPQRFYRVVLVE